MNCRLHGEEAELRESHIIPKFVYRWMKETGTGRFRQKAKLNTPLQDGFKTKLLCSKCEERFSKLETWFSRNVFNEYNKDKNYQVINSKNLFEFCLSISWRVINFYTEDLNKYKFRNLIENAELEWKESLLKGSSPSKFKNHHLILIDEKYNSDLESELYFLRAADIEIAESETKCFVYAKFGSFIIISEICGLEDCAIINSNLFEEASFTSVYQKINDIDVLDFFESRIKEVAFFDDLSDNQKEKNDNYFAKNEDKIIDSEYYKILKKYKS